MKTTNRRERITEKTKKQHQKLYMLFVNLVGFHRKVYVLNYLEGYDGYWSKSGNEGFQISDRKFMGLNISSDGDVLEFIYSDKNEAEMVHLAMGYLCEGIKSVIDDNFGEISNDVLIKLETGFDQNEVLLNVMNALKKQILNRI